MTHQASWSPADTALRTPPHNYEAEQALLGALLLNSAVLDKVAEIVSPEHFADPAHGRIYAAIRDLSDQGQRPNPVTLKSYFERDSGLAEIGGTAYLAQLANCVVSIINAEDYAKLVRDMADRRAIIEACMAAMGEAYEANITRIGSPYLNLRPSGHEPNILTHPQRATLAPYRDSVHRAKLPHAGQGGDIPPRPHHPADPNPASGSRSADQYWPECRHPCAQPLANESRSSHLFPATAPDACDRWGPSPMSLVYP